MNLYFAVLVLDLDIQPIETKKTLVGWLSPTFQQSAAEDGPQRAQMQLTLQHSSLFILYRL